MTDITLTNYTRTSQAVTAGDLIQVKQGKVLVGATNNAGNGVVMTPETAPISLSGTGTIWLEKISKEDAIVAHEAL